MAITTKDIDACMSNSKMMKEYPDKKQRLTACQTAVEAGKKCCGDSRGGTILDEVDKSLAKTYKYKNPKTGQVFEYKRPGIYKDDDGTSLVKVWD